MASSYCSEKSVAPGKSSGDECLHPFVAAGTSPDSAWRRAPPFHVIPGLCGALLHGAESWSFRAHPKRLLRRLSHFGRFAVATTSFGASCVTPRLLVSGVFEFGNDHRVSIGWSVGSWHVRHAAGGRRRTRERIARGHDQVGCLLRRANGYYVVCVDILGLAHEIGTVSSGRRLPVSGAPKEMCDGLSRPRQSPSPRRLH